jgi:hypothetical protein
LLIELWALFFLERWSFALGLWFLVWSWVFGLWSLNFELCVFLPSGGYKKQHNAKHKVQRPKTKDQRPKTKAA